MPFGLGCLATDCSQLFFKHFLPCFGSPDQTEFIPSGSESVAAHFLAHFPIFLRAAGSEAYEVGAHAEIDVVDGFHEQSSIRVFGCLKKISLDGTEWKDVAEDHTGLDVSIPFSI